MKKKHIQYTSNLLIGLFSLSTLSACVNTGQVLDMGGSNSKDASNNSSPFQAAARDATKEASDKFKYAAISAVVSGAFCGTVGYYAGSSNNSYSGSSNNSSYNSSTAPTGSNSTGGSFKMNKPSWGK